ncbi:MAG: HAMP domain-containing histidine kinase [Phycisphaeraceae bacterium]|nr:HAMP domain-containing histidine kinase [Phycisphaeraceae bacterium]
MRLPMRLATKCLLLFGGAVVFIVLAAMSGPWLRMTDLIDDGQIELSRELMITWERLENELADGDRTLALPGTPEESHPVSRGGIIAQRFTPAQINALNPPDEFLSRALERFNDNPSLEDLQEARWSGTARVYRYVKAVRSQAAPGEPARVTGVVLLRRPTFEAFRLLWVNGVFLLGAAVAVLGMALLVFYVITQGLILRPVRILKATTQRVREGNVAVRADIRTGDEFQDLAETINMMLSDMQAKQERLRALNTAMDVKLHELAESNSALHDTARMKGEFLANVSHELRTPLNSIIGFAELLLEQARAEADKPDAPPSVARRIRYLSNIDTAGRNLLTHINSLLEMARIEAGKVDLRLERMNLRDACEGLLGLIQPLADRKGIALTLEVADDVPNVITDPKKFQQIIFNFLSNAVKFIEPAEKTGREGRIIVRVERLVAARPGEEDRVRVCVIDNGPGIGEEHRERIFEKFYQADSAHTKEHMGTGLGLSICRELANILRCELQLDSAPGRGSMFSLIMPEAIEEGAAIEGTLEAKFRGSLSSGREWS